MTIDDKNIRPGSSNRAGGGTSSKPDLYSKGEDNPGDKIDMDLLKFERQETDDMDEDDQELLETERIDVKKDIALNDDMKDVGNSDIGMVLPDSSVNQDNIPILQNGIADIPQKLEKLMTVGVPVVGAHTSIASV